MLNKPLNILFSTTRGWNCGDDFILFGILNLFRSLIDFNPVIYNRNPNIHSLRTTFDRLVDLEKDGSPQKINFYTTLKPFLPHYDNSWNEHIDIDIFDLAVFAGTPEWLGGMVQPMVNSILSQNIPTMYLGIGSFEGIANLTMDRMPFNDKTLLEKAHLITVRDELCSKILSPLTVEQLPCPVLFAADNMRHKHTNSIKRIAFSIQGTDNNNGQKISKEVFDYAVELIKFISKHYECAVVCHYINELNELKPFLEDIPFYYSYDARDYIDIYNEFDLSITTRVHGAGLCASLCIPSFVISHSTRSDTVNGFLSEIIKPDFDNKEHILEKIQNYQILKVSNKLFKHKRDTFNTYKQLLKPIFENLRFIDTKENRKNIEQPRYKPMQPKPTQQKNEISRIQQLFQKATNHHQQGQLDEAEKFYRQILAISPKHTDSLHLLGIILADRGLLNEGLDLVNQAIDYNPNFAHYYLNRGLIYKRLNEIDKSIEDYKKAIQIEPRTIEAQCNLADALLEKEQVDEAITAYQNTIKINPKHRNAIHNLGNAYLLKENYEKALDCYKEALDLKNDCSETLSNIGVALMELDKIDEAIDYHKKAIFANSNFSKAYSNLGLALNRMNKFRDAEYYYRKALEIEPNDANVYSNLGVNCKDQGKVDEAIDYFRKSLDINPDSSKTKFNEAITLLLRGDFIEGWEKYESRFGLKERQATNYHFSEPVWQGEDFKDKTLFIYAEQGLGDTIQFARYLPYVAKRGGKIILECQRELMSLFQIEEQDHLKIDKVITRGMPKPHFDYHIAIMSLPRIFKTTLENIPAKTIYLLPPEDGFKLERKDKRQKRIEKVGLVWAGSTQHKNDKNRSVPLKYFEPLFDIDWLDFYSLQYERFEEVKNYPKVTDLSNKIKDFSDTAEIIRELDLVITVDTAVAHLSAAMSRPTWILLPFAPDFRWLLDRDDSPWYDYVTLFRQSGPCDWESVINEIKEKLTSFKNCVILGGDVKLMSFEDMK